MESWRTVWRRGIAPQLSDAGLAALGEALALDRPALLQGSTTDPPPLQSVADWPCEGACPVTYCGWKGDGLDTVAEAQEFFAQACFACDQEIGEPAACRWFLNWWDESPRPEARAALLEEVALELEARHAAQRVPA